MLSSSNVVTKLTLYIQILSHLASADVDASVALQWISKRAVHALVVFFVVVGSLAAGIYAKNPTNLAPGKKILSQLIAAMVFTLPMGYVIENTTWNAYWICFLAFFVGAMSDWGMRSAFLLWDDSEGFADFFSRIGKAAKAAWNAWGDIKNTGGNNTP